MTSSIPSVDALIRHMREQISGGNLDVAEYRSLIMQFSAPSSIDGTIDERAYDIEDDLKIIESWQGDSLPELKARLWLFTHQDAAPVDEAAPPASEDMRTDEIGDWGDASYADHADAPDDEYAADEPVAPVTTALPRWTVVIPAIAPAATADDTHEDHVPSVPPARVENANEKRLAAAEALTAGDAPDLVGAILQLEAIASPRSELSADQFRRYEAIRTDAELRRAAEQEQRRDTARARFDEARYALDEVIAAQNALLDPTVTRDGEEVAIRAQRELLTSPVWGAEKSARYLRHFEYANGTSFPTLDRRLEWLRAQRPSLEAIQSENARPELTARTAALIATVTSEIDTLSVALGKVTSRRLDSDFLGTIASFSGRSADDIVEDMHAPANEPRKTPLRELEPRLLREYAEFTFAQAIEQFKVAIGVLWEQALDRATTEADAALTLNGERSIEEIGKAIRLGLINLAPTRYIEKFPGLVSSDQNRSRDPDPNYIENTDRDRRRFILLRDTLLPHLLALHEQVLALAESRSLTDRYALMQIWAHTSVVRGVRELEDGEMQRFRNTTEIHRRALETGDFWIMNENEGELQQYIDEKIAPLQRATFMSVTLPARHPHGARLSDLKSEISELITEYTGLIDKRRAMERDIGKVQRLLETVRTRVAARDDANSIDESITTARRLLLEIQTNYHYRVGRQLIELDSLEQENNQRRSVQQITDEARLQFDIARQHEGERRNDQAAEVWRQITAKTQRYAETGTDGEPSAVRAMLLHHFAQIKSSYHRVQSLPVERYDERKLGAEDTKRLFDHFSQVYSQVSRDARVPLSESIVEDVGVIIAHMVERAIAAQENQRHVQQDSEKLERELIRYANGIGRLKVFNDHITAVQQLITSATDDDLRAALTFHRDLVGMRLDAEIVEHIDSFIKQAIVSNGEAIDSFIKQAIVSNGEAIDTAIDNAKRAGLRLTRAELDYKKFTTTYLSIATTQWEAAHAEADRPYKPPCDLILPLDSYRTWFMRRENAGGSLDEQRRTAIVAAYYLVARATTIDAATVAVDPLSHLLKAIDSANRSLMPIVDPDETIAASDQAAYKYLKDDFSGMAVNVLRDAILLLHAERCKSLIASDTGGDAVKEALSDGLAISARTQSALIVPSAITSVRVIGEMWLYRLDVLEHIARGDYHGARLKLNDFFDISATRFPTPSDADSEWARRRHYEITDSLRSQRDSLADRRLPNRTPATLTELQEYLTAILTLRNAPNHQADTMLQTVNDVALMNTVYAGIEADFADTLTRTLPRSLRLAASEVASQVEKLRAALHDIEKLQITIRGEGFPDFAGLLARMDKTRSYLADAVGTMEAGLVDIQHLLNDTGGVNGPNDWNERGLSDSLTEVTTSITAAEDTAQITITAFQRGSDDYVPFSTAVSTIISTLALVRSRRAEVQAVLNPFPTVEHIEAFKAMVAALEAVGGAQDSLNHVLSQNGINMKFQIPPRFFTTQLGQAIQYLPAQVPISLEGSPDFEGLITRLSMTDDEAERKTWIQAWQRNRGTVSLIVGFMDHQIIAQLLADRAQRWTGALLALQGALVNYYTEWLDVAMWHAYYNRILTTLCRLTDTAYGDPLPDGNQFSQMALGLFDLQPQISPQGRFSTIAREIEEYTAEADRLLDKLTQTQKMGAIPSELMPLWDAMLDSVIQNLIDQKRNKQIVSIGDYVMVGDRREVSLSLHEALSEAGSLNERLERVRDQVSAHRQYVEASVVKRGLTYVIKHITDVYLPVLDDGNSYYRDAVAHSRNANQRATLTAQHNKVKAVIELFRL